MSDGHDTIGEQAETDETLLVIINTIVMCRHNGSGKYRFAVGEIDAVLLQVAPTLAFVPLELHVAAPIVTTICSCRKPDLLALGRQISSSLCSDEEEGTLEVHLDQLCISLCWREM
jgi:hypothetical protein